MIRPSHRSPLFPYTTLFRSKAATRFRLVSQGAAKPLADFAQLEPGSKLATSSLIDFVYRRSGINQRAEDRKSTRLNSSHLVNSYAAICLTKKKKNKKWHNI